MTGLSIRTKEHLLPTIEPIFPLLCYHVWIVESSYAPFLWAGGLEDAPPGFDELVPRISNEPIAYALDSDALELFDSLMSLDWVDVIALPPLTDPQEWWTRSGAGPREPNRIYGPSRKLIAAEADLIAKRIDHALWIIYCRDPEWTALLRQAHPSASQTDLPNEEA